MGKQVVGRWRRMEVVCQPPPFSKGHGCPHKQQCRYPLWVLKKRRWPPQLPKENK